MLKVGIALTPIGLLFISSILQATYAGQRPQTIVARSKRNTKRTSNLRHKIGIFEKRNQYTVARKTAARYGPGIDCASGTGRI